MNNIIYSLHPLDFRLYQNLLNHKTTFISSAISSSLHKLLLAYPPVLELLVWYSDVIKCECSKMLALYNELWVNIVFPVYLLLFLNVGILKVTYGENKKHQKHLHRYPSPGKFCIVLKKFSLLHLGLYFISN